MVLVYGLWHDIMLQYTINILVHISLRFQVKTGYCVWLTRTEKMIGWSDIVIIAMCVSLVWFADEGWINLKLQRTVLFISAMDIVTTKKDGQSILPEPCKNDDLGQDIANKNNDTGTIHSDTINKPPQGMAPTALIKNECPLIMHTCILACVLACFL